MPWPHCSRTGSRRKGPVRRPVRAIIGVVLTLVAASLPAQLQHQTTLRSEEDHLSVSITAAGADIAALFDTIHRGLRARVEYRIRLSTSRSRPFLFLGDRLLREYHPILEVHWDPYLLAYVLERDDGTERLYTDEAALYADFFTLSDFRIPWEEIRREPGLVVEATTEYTPIVFVAGLNILTLFTANRRETSPWSRHVVGSVGVKR